MKLDPRIIEGRKPLICFDCEEAKHFIGRQGYFSDHVTDFADLDDTYGIAILGMVDDSNWNYPFMAAPGAAVGKARYFLPAEWVQEKELQWRPYTLGEFIDMVGEVGDVVTYRFHDKNNTSQCEWTSLIIEIEDCQDSKSETCQPKIYIGGCEFLLKELFEHYEYRINGQWHRFGVME